MRKLDIWDSKCGALQFCHSKRGLRKNRPRSVALLIMLPLTQISNFLMLYEQSCLLDKDAGSNF